MELLKRTLLCLVALLPLSASETGTKIGLDKNVIITCDGFEAQLQCPPKTLIEVNEAFYGRTNDDFCVGPKLTDKCTVGSVAKVVSSVRCNYKNACRIPTSVFGPDPCVGTHKFLKVTYSCKALPTAVSCDGDPKGYSIRCPTGMFIAVRDAFFGRISDEHCAFGPRLNYACSLAGAKTLISNTCNNKETCAVVFPSDPCPGTVKYMAAIHECLDHQTQVACDDAGTLSISCPPNKNIQVLSTFYGRTSDEVCAHGPRNTYDCVSATAPAKVASTCNNKPLCRIPLNEVGGDPCPGTLKYAIVKYKCV